MHIQEANEIMLVLCQCLNNFCHHNHQATTAVIAAQYNKINAEYSILLNIAGSPVFVVPLELINGLFSIAGTTKDIN